MGGGNKGENVKILMEDNFKVDFSPMSSQLKSVRSLADVFRLIYLPTRAPTAPEPLIKFMYLVVIDTNIFDIF
jgi:hypothetical protein